MLRALFTVLTFLALVVFLILTLLKMTAGSARGAEPDHALRARAALALAVACQGPDAPHAPAPRKGCVCGPDCPCRPETKCGPSTCPVLPTPRKKRGPVLRVGRTVRVLSAPAYERPGQVTTYVFPPAQSYTPVIFGGGCGYSGCGGGGGLPAATMPAPMIVGGSGGFGGMVGGGGGCGGGG